MEGYNITNNTNNYLWKFCLLLQQGYKVENIYINVISKIKACVKKFTFFLELLVICMYFCMGHMQKTWNI
jgi:hypothetical protein